MAAKNPADLTRRNNNARKKEIAALNVRLKKVERALKAVSKATK